MKTVEVDFKNEKCIVGNPDEKEEDNKAQFIDLQWETMSRLSYNQNVVFVHCAMGVSRSASCVIMYIMKKFRIGYQDVSSII